MSITNTTTVRVPKLGDRLKATYIPSVTRTDSPDPYTGQIVTVTRVEEKSSRDSKVDANGSGIYEMRTVVYGIFRGVDGRTPEYFFSEWEFIDSDAPDAPVEPVEPTPLDLLQAKYDALEADYRTMRNEAITAIERIGNRLISEADTRDWCGVYDSIIEDVNEDIPSWLALPVREREFEIEAQVDIRVRLTATIEATTLAAAIENATYDLDISDMISEAVRYNGNYEVVDITWDEA